MPEFTIPNQNVDLKNVASLLARVEGLRVEYERKEAIFGELGNLISLCSPNGFPFHCTRCKAKGFSLDFHSLMRRNCPVCFREGVVEMGHLTSSSISAGEREMLQLTAVSLVLCKVWLESLEDRPEELYASVVTSLRRMKDYGIAI